MLVLDASIVIELLISDDIKKVARLEQRLENEVLVAPDHMWVEVVSVISRLARTGQLSDSDAERTIFYFQRLTIRPLGTNGSLHRIWGLRQNVHAFDAAYVSLAESLASPLLTCDKKLSRAIGPKCEIEVW